MHRSAVLLGALLCSAVAEAGEPVVLDGEDPTAQLAQALGEVLRDASPPRSAAVLFRDCDAPTSCAGQVPSWFSHPSWLRGIERSGLSLVPLESTVGRATLNRIDQALQGQPEARVDALLEQLEYADTVSVLLYVRPEQGADARLVWSVVDTQRRAVLAEGVLTYAESAPAPEPVTAVTLTGPEPSGDEAGAGRPVLPWVGAGVGLLGAASVGWTWSRYRADPTIILTTDGAARVRNPYVFANSAGWAGVAAGTVMVTVPLVSGARR